MPTRSSKSRPSGNPAGTGETTLPKDENVSTDSGRLRKQPKTFHYGNPTGLQHSDYTIAWVCALKLEMEAAQAMLDVIHEPLLTDADDTNTYVLGSIKGHNIVIGCLLSYYPSPGSTAVVIANMMRSFPEIRRGLTVGIGDGVPSKVDLRLGDIVVGTSVIQLELGKSVEEGDLQRTAILRIPGQALMTALSALRAKHELAPSQVPFILQEKFEGNDPYSRPRLADSLYEPDYCHTSSGNCDTCDPSKLVSRPTRSPNDVRIHYGAIGSGDEYVRDGIIRDRLGQDLDIICFGVRTAGVMDTLPCLPILGICNYSDTHEDHEWKSYAAATAAAYARELLEILPVAQERAEIVCVPESYQPSPLAQRQRLPDYLRFNNIASQRLNIEPIHVQTCQWFISHPEYQAWLDPARLKEHNGILWIDGKPGAGKSTIMEFAYLEMQHRSHHDRGLVAAFFFEARAGYLKGSAQELYQSLLLQLLEGYPDLQMVLDDVELVPWIQETCPPSHVLEQVFCDAISALGQRPFTCFVDGVSECNEQEAVNMVRVLEDLAEQCAAKRIPFRICFSARHYPCIPILKGIRLTLEDQSGHAEAISAYVTSRIRLHNPTLVEEMKSEILRKASGIFTWVVQVVDILNKEHRRGGSALRKRFAESPKDLSKLFEDTLMRDREGLAIFQLCASWILYAKRPLHPKEFYHALWSGLAPKGLMDEELPNVNLPTVDGNPGQFERFVISSSKGLAEVKRSNPPTVQFIHESLRNFLLHKNPLRRVWSELQFNSEALAHTKIKRCCIFYMNYELLHVAARKLKSQSRSNRREEILREYPFLEYAKLNLSYHTSEAMK
ncbi:hypothetical protein N7457_006197 [Penicillium paradoxum]|uniref:uncharacterized protein n=1 Tax=Penicillium paradoxum TaxID=176176 RepID=UPI002547B128|nr:uncharacterized protein N7457_006197 [Penicillium paradoxum]KAJ5781037.1 hypothetical protein N7457_006197 [Penicillium paradoxum]